MKVDRKELLEVLACVAPGLSKAEGVEQAQCFIFMGDKVMTYNDEITVAASYKTEFTGAVKADEFQRLLRKLKDDEVDITDEGTELLVKTKKTRAGIALEADVAAHIESFKLPGKTEYNKLPEGFTEAIKFCSFSAANDMTKPILMCIHVAGNRATSSDGIRITQYKLGGEVEEPILIQAAAAVQLCKYKPTHCCVQGGWLYFKVAKAFFCCRTFEEEYPDVSPHLKVKGAKVTLPKGFKDLLDKANIFAAGTKDVARVSIKLAPGVMEVKGKGDSGWIKERAKLDYDGEEVSFMARPEFLMEAVGLLDNITVGERSLKLQAKEFIHVVAIMAG